MPRIYVLLLFVSLCSASVLAQDTKFNPEFEQIPGPDCGVKGAWPTPPAPCKASELQEWLNDVRHWRAERKIRVGYDGAQYDRPELKWAQSSFIQPQVMIEDRYLYDSVAGKYTVDRYLKDLEKRYGGIDSVLLWHTYPNIGVDNRNQHDLLRDMPGGVAGIKQMIDDFHRRGVKVLFPIMLWDQGTRDEGRPNWEATAKLMADVGADGINGDTLDGVARVFRQTSDTLGHPLVLEPEVGPNDEAVAWNNMSWGYWKYQFTPAVSRYKWLEPRHMVNVCDRWNKDKTDNLQFAFFNGVGYESWENIWGIWNQITPRDSEALRRISKIERGFKDHLVSPDWEPFAPMLRAGVYASKWPSGGAVLWTIVNRNQYAIEGRQMELPVSEGTRYFDLWHGVELKPSRSGDKLILSFNLEPLGYGAILASNSALDGNAATLLEQMRELSQTPLQAFSHEWKFLPQQLVETTKTGAPRSTAGMIKIPEADFLFSVYGVEIEGGNDVGVDVQYPWEDSPRRYHEHRVHINSFWIDKYPVTNLEFKKFLDASHYEPQDTHNFLKHWVNGTYPEGSANQPVVWVSIEDARAYAKWAGKRLPHEWEWQYAAQGLDGRLYPWGNEWRTDAVPPVDKRREMRAPTNVDAYPKGASPFGLMDLVGNVWQWTDEFADEHTRGGILRGGSFYKPQGSVWYFPQAYELNKHGKYLLIAPSKDRSGTIGFRCVSDAN